MAQQMSTPSLTPCLKQSTETDQVTFKGQGFEQRMSGEVVKAPEESLSSVQRRDTLD